MYRCSAELRSLCLTAHDADEGANRIISYFYEQLLRPGTREPACGLVRLFRTRPLSSLSPKDAAAAMAADPSLGALDPNTVCLSLRATRGIEPDWNDPALSRHHRLTPLSSEQVASNLPMASALVADLGIPSCLLSVEPAVPKELRSYFKVFHVEHAPGSPLVPAQEEFVKPYGIQSVLGFGGLLVQAQAFVVMLFSRVTISKRTAELFQTLAPSVALALIQSGRNEYPREAAICCYELIVRHHEQIALIRNQELRASAEERARLLARAESAKEEALAASRAKDEFLAILRHELRNPLAPIVTAVEIMKLRGARSREQEIIERQAVHLHLVR